MIAACAVCSAGNVARQIATTNVPARFMNGPIIAVSPYEQKWIGLVAQADDWEPSKGNSE